MNDWQLEGSFDVVVAIREMARLLAALEVRLKRVEGAGGGETPPVQEGDAGPATVADARPRRLAADARPRRFAKPSGSGETKGAKSG